MNEKEMMNLMQNLDNDLLDRELDALTEHMDIDVDSILSKAQSKLEQERKKLKKIKFIPLVAALCLVLGAGAVYAQEISDFVKTFFGKSIVYSTVVDGTVYILESPQALGSGEQLHSAVSLNDRLDLVIDMELTDFEGITATVGGKEYEPGGYSRGPNGHEFSFYDTPQTKEFTLTLYGKAYQVKLVLAGAAVDDGEIIPAEQNDIDWVNIGYKRIDGGVQIFTSFDKNNLQLATIGTPISTEVQSSFAHHPDGSWGGSTTSSLPYPLLGRDGQGNEYEYSFNADEVGRPLTRFYSDVPAGQAVTLRIPHIVVRDESKYTGVKIELPGVGEKTEPKQAMRFALQAMELESVQRTSSTEAVLIFRLNTMEDARVSIWEVDLDGKELQEGELLWKDGVCTMKVTFPETLERFELRVGNPTYVVSGDWVLEIQ